MKRKRRIMLAVFAVMFAMLCMPQRAEAARKAVWKDVDGVWYAYRGSKLVRNKWVGDYYAGPDGSLVKNQWIGEYFVGEDGKWIENFKGGWYKINKKYYYYIIHKQVITSFIFLFQLIMKFICKMKKINYATTKNSQIFTL